MRRAARERPRFRDADGVPELEGPRSLRFTGEVACSFLIPHLPFPILQPPFLIPMTTVPVPAASIESFPARTGLSSRTGPLAAPFCLDHRERRPPHRGG